VAVDAVVPSGLVADTIVAMISGEDQPVAASGPNPGPPSGANPASRGVDSTICPECGGVLSERIVDGVATWECQVGHRYPPERLVDGQADDVEAALWAALRALEDRSRLLERMARQCEERGYSRSMRSFRARASSTREQALIVRDALAGAAQLGLRRGAETDRDEVAH
jgi:two-component system chemotaxis response regulator CheB